MAWYNFGNFTYKENISLTSSLFLQLPAGLPALAALAVLSALALSWLSWKRRTTHELNKLLIYMKHGYKGLLILKISNLCLRLTRGWVRIKVWNCSRNLFPWLSLWDRRTRLKKQRIRPKMTSMVYLTIKVKKKSHTYSSMVGSKPFPGGSSSDILKVLKNYI